MPRPAQRRDEPADEIGFWAGTIGASNSMVTGGVLSLVTKLLIAWWWKPNRGYRSP